MAIALSDAGYDVYAVGRSQAALKELQAERPGIVPIAGGDATWHSLIVAERWRDYGWWILVGSDGRDRMPDTLRACLDAAEAAGADWLQLDRDCEPIAALPTHDW